MGGGGVHLLKEKYLKRIFLLRVEPHLVEGRKKKENGRNAFTENILIHEDWGGSGGGSNMEKFSPL